MTGSGAVAILADVNDHPEHVTRYFEEYVPGLTVDCGTFSVSEGEIVAFATEYDPQPFHIDSAGARDGPFGGLIASGWQTTSLMMRQLVEYFVSPQSSLGAAGVDEVRWPRPVRPGDTLHVLATVLEARRSNSKPDRGIIRSLAEVTNQHGELVMKLTAINFVLARKPLRPRMAVLAGVPPGERREVRLDPAALRLRACQRYRAVEAGQQALVEQRGVALGEGAEVAFAALGRVVPDEFNPGAADGRVIFLRHARVAGRALDAVADQGDR